MAILEPTLPYMLICTLMILADCYTAWALIIMSFLIQRHITDGMPIDLTKVAAGAICFWQLWSILENESSCNGAKWAKVMQKILVDKTSRHFDIDLDDLVEQAPNGDEV